MTKTHTQARIRRWALLEHVSVLMVAVGVGVCALMVVVNIYIGIFRDDLIDHLWWLWPVTVGMLLVSFIPWAMAHTKRVDAMYADGWSSVGKVTEVVEANHHDSDAARSYDVTITTAPPEAGSILRVIRRGEAPRIGQQILFRHNTFDRKNLRDALFVEFVDRARSDHERRKR